MSVSYRRVDLIAGSWTAEGVVVASRFAQRLRGVRTHGVDSILLRCRSVHTVGLPAAIGVVALDDAGSVLWARRVRPNRLVIIWSAGWILELPTTAPMPTVGATIVASSRHAGNTHLVRHPDRKPR